MINRTFHCIIYTTTGSIPQSHLDSIREMLLKARGISEISFEEKRISPDFSSYTPDLSEPNKTTVNWPWIKAHITGAKSDMECVHLTSYERDMLGMKHPTCSALGGLYDVDKDDTLDFIMFGDLYSKAGNYPDMYEFVRIFVHEACHGFDHWTNSRITPIVHAWDDGLHRLPELPGKFNFETHNILAEILGLVDQLVDIKNQPLADVAERFLHTDASPMNYAPDTLACAETVSSILGTMMDFRVQISTAVLREVLLSDPRFEKVHSPCRDAIIISATGLSNSKEVVNGHTGIIASDGFAIMSNSSATGTFEKNYTITSWTERWGKAGYPIEYFIIKK